jgi:hypothetical protein
LKKNSKSAMKKEPKAKRVKAQRPMQREPKEVLAELVEKLRGKLRRLGGDLLLVQQKQNPKPITMERSSTELRFASFVARL